MNMCIVDGCNEKIAYIKLGLCSKHYLRKYRYGDVDFIKSPKFGTKEDIYKLIKRKIKVDVNGCWVFYTGKGKRRFPGAVTYNGRKISTYVFMWEYNNNRVRPDGMEVCHSCDNPPCCNPEHLWLGTHDDNMKDMVDKGRSQKCSSGGGNGNSKITNKYADEIYRIYWKYRHLSDIKRSKKYIYIKDLAKEYGVSYRCVYNIVMNFSFKELKLKDKYKKYHKPQLARSCMVDGCCGQIKGLGYCNRHYQSFKVYGDPLMAKTIKKRRKKL